jgi:hypothetical protein
LLLALFTLAGEHRANAQGSPLLLASSGRTTCDIGPPLPTSAIPPGAKLAGFTHCAANFDFSQPLYATLSNWFDCDGRNPNVLWHKGSAGVNFVNPCSIHQKVDPVTGQKVMNFHWDASYGNRGNGTQANQVGGWTYNNFNHTSSFDVGNYYIETTSRLEQLCPNCAQNSGGPDDVYTWMTGQTDPDEVDIYEFQTNDAGGDTGVAAGNCCGIPAWTNWGPNKNALPAGHRVLNYYRYGALQTSDGATSKYICMYINDVLQGAGCGSAGSTLKARNNVLVSAGSNAGTSSQNIDMDVGYIRVWSCDAWKTSLCNGTARVAGANGLTYWH